MNNNTPKKSKIKTVSRVERCVIKETDDVFPVIMDYCHKSKNLYNHANYVIRQSFTQKDENGNNIGKYIIYKEIDKILKADLEYPDYKDMPTAQSAQQTLMILDKNWKSFFKSIKDYKKNPKKYLGRPKLPKFLPKEGYFVLVFTNQNCKLKADKLIHFPKVFGKFVMPVKFVNREDFYSFQQVRILPRKNKLIMEVIYKIKLIDKQKNNERYIGSDLGVNNLATVCNNIGETPFIINGKPVKSYNQYYNKKLAYYKSKLEKRNKQKTSKRIRSLTEKRNLKINDYLHKASRKIVNFCQEHLISAIVIGKNKNWKQKAKMSDKNNQNFVQIPFARFIQLIQYKAEECGIEVITSEESYTSGTSFVDDENPVKENYDKKRRKHRGLFITNSGIEINADLNGAYQILKKVFPIKWDRGCGLHPKVAALA